MMETSHPNETDSLCPVCLRKIKAERLYQGDEVFLVKECGDHGSFRTIIWRGKPSLSEWRRPKAPAHPDLCYGKVEKGCPFDCGLCEAHIQLPCSVLIEVTERCNLHCPVCFADSGKGESEDPSLDRISRMLERAMAAAGPCNLQLSGGEPTIRDDLPEIVNIARRIGYSFIQLNTNGLRLSLDNGLGRELKDAGLSSVFLQFDGVDDEVNQSLRGAALLETKLQAVRNSGEAGLGVILVPTLIEGVNTDSIGGIVRQALQLAPVVRGIHFQPISYFGRFSGFKGDQDRFTLPELMRGLEAQTDAMIKVSDFSPPGCEHAYCSFHATYMHSSEGGLKLMGASYGDDCCPSGIPSGGVRQTVETVSRRWVLPSSTTILNRPPVSRFNPRCCPDNRDKTMDEGFPDLDLFLQDVADKTFTISAMAFQDAYNLDLERLRACCISVISQDGMLVPFCVYNLTSREGKGLYRRRKG